MSTSGCFGRFAVPGVDLDDPTTWQTFQREMHHAVTAQGSSIVDLAGVLNNLARKQVVNERDADDRFHTFMMEAKKDVFSTRAVIIKMRATPCLADLAHKYFVDPATLDEYGRPPAGQAAVPASIAPDVQVAKVARVAATPSIAVQTAPIYDATLWSNIRACPISLILLPKHRNNIGAAMADLVSRELRMFGSPLRFLGNASDDIPESIRRRVLGKSEYDDGQWYELVDIVQKDPRIATPFWRVCMTIWRPYRLGIANYLRFPDTEFMSEYLVLSPSQLVPKECESSTDVLVKAINRLADVVPRVLACPPVRIETDGDEDL